tara:strand:+ start:94 stop:504 length:411 start_codon:yes stop_codon:yes gene_type:complete
MKDSPMYFKLGPDRIKEKEKDTATAFSEKDTALMYGSAMNMGHPMNYGSPMNTNDPNKKKKGDDFDYTPTTPGAGVTGTMVTETVGKGTGKPIYEKGKKSGGFEPKETGDKLAGGGKVLSTSKDKKRQKVKTIKFS